MIACHDPVHTSRVFYLLPETHPKCREAKETSFMAKDVDARL